MQELGFHLSMRHLSVQNTLKSENLKAQGGTAYPWKKSCVSWQGVQEPSLQKPSPTQKHLLMLCGHLIYTTCGEASPPVVMDPLWTHRRRRFPLERQRKEMGRAKGSQTLTGPYSSLPAVRHLRLDKELGGQWNPSSRLILEHFVQLQTCLFLS